MRKKILAGSSDHRLGAVRAEHHRRVVLGLEPEPVTDLIDHEQVGSLTGEFFPAEIEKISPWPAGLRGKTDEQLTRLARGNQFGQDVRVTDQRDGFRVAIRFLDLMGRPGDGPEIGDRRRHDDHVGRCRLRVHGGPQLHGRDHSDGVGSGHLRKSHVGRHHDNPRAPGERRSGQRVALATA